MTREKRAMLVQEVLAAAPFSMRQLAEESGLSYAMLRGWKIGRRVPLPENLARLADALERRGGDLNKLAEQLRREAGE